jgi:hypothetical protein
MDFNPNECSWEQFRKKGDTSVCSSPEVVQKMKDFLTALGEKMDSVDPNKFQDKKDIVNKLKEKTGCKSESCVIQSDKFQNFAGSELLQQNLKENFKTKGPSFSTEWISNFHITDVLKKVSETWSEESFWPVPFQMRDFKKNSPSETAAGHVKDSNLETLDLCKKYDEGSRCFGVVINTDYSTGSGIHWFCLFVDMRNPKFTIEYFNSSGSEPLTEISAWMKKTRLLLEQKFSDKKIEIIKASQVEHQKDDHSCGIYSLYYIISRVVRIPYEYFQKNIIKTNKMHKFRNFLFRYDA